MSWYLVVISENIQLYYSIFYVMMDTDTVRIDTDTVRMDTDTADNFISIQVNLSPSHNSPIVSFLFKSMSVLVTTKKISFLIFLPMV